MIFYRFSVLKKVLAGKKHRKGCVKMTLKEQVINKVQLMPDEQMRQLVPFVDFLFYSWRQASPEGTAAAAKGTNRRNLKGIMPGKVIMADDFDETPDCFKEYM